VEKKGLEYLIQAFALVAPQATGARLAIAGEGPLRRPLERLTSECGLTSRVAFHGSLPHQAVADLMRSSSIVCQPSVTAADGDSEGLPTVALEAAATAAGACRRNPEIVVTGRPASWWRRRPTLADRLLLLKNVTSDDGRSGSKRIEERFD
jgi:glycosyltransferase involved in cell wall biosynthesis